MRRTSAAFLLAVAIAVAAPLAAQTPPLRLPPASPKASVSQTVGMTEITVRYSRPAVKGRKVWGDTGTDSFSVLPDGFSRTFQRGLCRRRARQDLNLVPRRRDAQGPRGEGRNG